MKQSVNKDQKFVEAEISKPAIMEGDFGSISLADVLQLLSTRSGQHVVEIVSDKILGKIYLEGPDLYHVEVLGEEEKEGFEAFCFLLSLKEGHFEVREPVFWPEEGNLKGPVQALLIEAVRQEDEKEGQDFFFNEDLFEEVRVESSDPSQKALLLKIQKDFPEIKLSVLMGPDGMIEEMAGEGEREAEELSGFVSYGFIQLREVGELLGLGELQAFAISGKGKLCAGLPKGEKIFGFCGLPRKGLLWWGQKLLETVKKIKS